MLILAPPPDAPRDAWPGVRARLVGMAAPLFVELIAPAVWAAALEYAVNPSGAVAQAFKETAGGRFGGAVSPGFHNPCGLKNREPLFPGVDDGDRPLAHARFPNWRVGATAQAQHLRAYAGCPVSGLIVDPRYSLVLGGPVCTRFADLDGRWAGPRYGTEIESLAARIAGKG